MNPRQKQEQMFQLNKLFKPREIHPDVFKVLDVGDFWQTLIRASRVQERISGTIETVTPVEFAGSKVAGSQKIFMDAVYQLSTKFRLQDEGLNKVKTDGPLKEVTETHRELEQALSRYHRVKEEMREEADKKWREDSRFYLTLGISIVALLLSVYAALIRD